MVCSAACNDQWLHASSPLANDHLHDLTLDRTKLNRLHKAAATADQGREEDDF